MGCCVCLLFRFIGLARSLVRSVCAALRLLAVVSFAVSQRFHVMFPCFMSRCASHPHHRLLPLPYRAAPFKPHTRTPPVLLTLLHNHRHLIGACRPARLHREVDHRAARGALGHAVLVRYLQFPLDEGRLCGVKCTWVWFRLRWCGRAMGIQSSVIRIDKSIVLCRFPVRMVRMHGANRVRKDTKSKLN